MRDSEMMCKPAHSLRANTTRERKPWYNRGLFTYTVEGTLLTLIADLVDQIAGMPGSDQLSNLYDSTHPGGKERRQNFTRYLEDMASLQPHRVMIFEAPGYRGCRWTGIPVTSERIMLPGIAKWGGLFGEGYQATSDVPDGYAEMTASILWNALIDLADEPPLIWNTVPLHPHKEGQPMSNRTPRMGEQRAGGTLFADLLTIFPCKEILAVGRTAQRMLAEYGYESIPLRHPSQGGKPEFIRGLMKALSR